MSFLQDVKPSTLGYKLSDNVNVFLLRHSGALCIK